MEQLATLSVDLYSCYVLATVLWTAATLPINQRLIHLCSSAHAGYCQRLKQEAANEEALRRKKLEEELFSEVASEKRASKKFATVEEELDKKGSEIEEKIREREKALKLMEEVQKSAKLKEQELDDLRKEQEKLQKKKEKESQRITDAVIKRTAKMMASTNEEPQEKKIRLLRD